jgi:predicted Na+-dependent transporter
MDDRALGSAWRVLVQYRELAWVLVAAAIGLAAGRPGRVLISHGAINLLLAILVFSAALGVPPLAGRLGRQGLALVAATVVTGVGVAAIAWLVAHLVSAGPLRLGVIAAGVAPVEIATLAVAPLAGGAALSSAVLLITSTALTALLAGPGLSLLAGGTAVHTGSLVTTLVVVVVVPFALGLAVRNRVGPRGQAAGTTTATAAVVVLVWLVASEVHLSGAYVAVAAAFVLLIVGGAALGAGVGRFVDRPSGVSVVFAGSMRDFAVAAGIATAAFGASAAAPLGLYGILVMVWGTGLAATIRRLSRA